MAKSLLAAEIAGVPEENFHPRPTELPSRQSPSGFSLTSLGIGPVTLVLIALSAIVAIFSSLGDKESALSPLFITMDASNESGQWLPEIRNGQVWRIITPIFIHFGIMHLVFNMLWMKDLGTMIERRGSSMLLIALVLVTGICSNLAQFIFAGPSFGGMSGVVYGLLGYVWMKSRFDRGSGYVLHQQTVIMMIAWFFLCVFGAMGPVANYAHGAGLLVGMAWGYFAAKLRPTRW